MIRQRQRIENLVWKPTYDMQTHALHWILLRCCLSDVGYPDCSVWFHVLDQAAPLISKIGWATKRHQSMVGSLHYGMFKKKNKVEAITLVNTKGCPASILFSFFWQQQHGTMKNLLTRYHTFLGCDHVFLAQ